MHTKLMVDSGAYSAWARNQKLPVGKRKEPKSIIPVQEYIDWIHACLKRHPRMKYVNLDVIGDGAASYDNWIEMRRQGLNPLPVYHAPSDIKWLHKYLEHTNWLGIGAIVKMTTKERIPALDRIWGEHLVDKQGMPTCKIHGMGITSWSLMKRYPWHSVDSTSWLQMAMFGRVLIARTKNGEWDYSQKPIAIGASEDSPTKKQKGKSLMTISPAESKITQRYLAFVGMKMGKTGDNGEVEEEGILNSWRCRCRMNVLFFARFMQHLEWPRPFESHRPKGIFQ